MYRIKKIIIRTKSAFICISLALFVTGCHSPMPKETVYLPKDHYTSIKNVEAKIGMQRGELDLNTIKKYNKIYINVIVPKQQLPMSFFSGCNVMNLFYSHHEQVEMIAEYAKKSLDKAFNEESIYKVSKTKGPKTLVLDFAIVQMVPNKPIIGSIKTITTFTPIGFLLTPVKMTIAGVSPNSGGSVAMESVIRSSQTGKVLGFFTDKEKGKIAVLNFKNFSASSSIKANIDEWSQQIVQTFNQVKLGEKLKADNNRRWRIVVF